MRLLVVLVGLLLVGCNSAAPVSVAPTATPELAIKSSSNLENAVPPSVTAVTSPDEYTQLEQRPLNLPTVAASDPCPVTTPDKQVSPDFANAIGPGPVYAVGTAQGVARFAPPNSVQLLAGGWNPKKILWVSDRNYLGPVLVRGHQIDGPRELRVGTSTTGERMHFAAESHADADSRSSSGWRHWPSYTYVQAPGCYAWQVDGRDFSYSIVFEAVVEQ